MIFYYSGTGNSQLVAKQLAEHLQDDLVSINTSWKKGEQETFHSEKPLVFVSPTYSWRVPRIVEQWIHKTHFEGNRNCYFVLTCGGSCGNAAPYAEKFCVQEGLLFRGLAPVLMPENYLALFEVPDEKECRQILENAKPRVAELAGYIQKNALFPKRPVTLKDRLESWPINPLFYWFVVKDKDFRVSDACISCGKCVKRCPLENLTLEQGKPVWHGRCTHCMACIGGCPAQAIEYKESSQGKRRYYIMEE